MPKLSGILLPSAYILQTTTNVMLTNSNKPFLLLGLVLVSVYLYDYRGNTQGSRIPVISSLLYSLWLWMDKAFPHSLWSFSVQVWDACDLNHFVWNSAILTKEKESSHRNGTRCEDGQVCRVHIHILPNCWHGKALMPTYHTLYTSMGTEVSTKAAF